MVIIACKGEREREKRKDGINSNLTYCISYGIVLALAYYAFDCFLVDFEFDSKHF